MISFGWAPGLALAATAAVPVALHLLHRTRWVPVPWPAMRLLADLATRRGTRLAVEDLLLLALRVLLLCALALTIARPRWSEPVAAADRHGRIAGVMLVDDGTPAALRGANGTPRLELARELTRTWLSSLTPGDEVSVIAGSTAEGPAADPLFDLAAAGRLLDGLRPGVTAPDLPGLLAAGIARLDRHRNPEAELVLAVGGCAAGAALDDDARWSVVRERLARARWPGWRRPRVLLLAPAEPPATDWAITDIGVDQPLPLPGVPVQVRVRIARSGEAPAPPGLALRLAVDGRTVEERPVPPLAGDTVGVLFPCTFTEAGSHLIEARLIGARDPLPEDDRRAAGIEVAVRVPVLLVEARSGELDLFAAALDPTGGRDPSAPFAPRRVSAALLEATDLRGMRAVVIGDAGVLEPAATAALERFVAAGGGVLLGCGPATDPELANRQWFRGGDGLLAAALAADAGRPAHPRPAPGDPPALAGFARGSPAWTAGTVQQALTAQPGAWQRIVDLDDGRPLIISARRGQGTTALCLTTFDDRWHDLPWRSLWVPLVRGTVASLAATVLPPRNLHVGEILSWPCAPPAIAARATLIGPDGALVPLRPGGWEGSPALIAGPLLQPGGLHLRPTDPADGPPVVFTSAIAPRALDLAPLPVDRLRARLTEAGCTVVVARTVGDVRRLTATDEAGGTIDGTPWCAALALLLLLAELALARRLGKGAP